jgi:hypothetical protein
MKRLLAGTAMAIGLAASAQAHHSFASFYFEDQSISIEGDVVQFDYLAPHAWVHLMAPDSGGRTQRFSAEWANPSRLARDGILRDTIKPGDRVVITGSPGRNAAEFKVHLKQIRRPADGWTWGQRRRRT